MLSCPLFYARVVQVGHLVVDAKMLGSGDDEEAPEDPPLVDQDAAGPMMVKLVKRIKVRGH